MHALVFKKTRRCSALVFCLKLILKILCRPRLHLSPSACSTCASRCSIERQDAAHPCACHPTGLPDSQEAPNLTAAGLHIVFVISCEWQIQLLCLLVLRTWPCSDRKLFHLHAAPTEIMYQHRHSSGPQKHFAWLALIWKATCRQPPRPPKC